MLIRERLEANLKEARQYQERIVKDLASSQDRVTRLETALQGLTPEREHYVSELVDTHVLELERPF